MAQWEYRTLLYGTPERGMRRWVITASRADTASKAVGESERSSFIGRIWQALRLLETALKELDGEGWEFVSTSFSGMFTLYGVAVLRRRIDKDQTPA